jgi:hypothetical protein
MEQPSLFQIGEVINAFSKDAIHWTSFRWLYNQLPLSARLMTKVGIASTSWWKERYILPVLCQAAIPHLTRLVNGVWKQHEELFFHRICTFLIQYKNLLPHLLPKKLLAVFDEKLPSFIDEQNLAKSRCTELGFKDAHCGWHRDETFAHYRSRMKNLVPKKTPIHTQPSPPPVPSLSPQTQVQVERAIESMHKLHEECVKSYAHLTPLLQKSTPFRGDFPDLFASLHVLTEQLLSLQLSIDKFLSSLPDPLSWTVLGEEEMKEVLANITAGYNRFSKEYATARNKAAALEGDLIAARRSVDQFFSAMLHMIHNTPALPESSPLYAKQTALLRRTHEIIKLSRASLRSGSGHIFSRQETKNEIQRLLNVAHDLYKEGSEIALLDEQLVSLSNEIEELLSEDRHRSSLRKQLDECLTLRSNLHLIVDRDQRYKDLHTAFVEFKQKRGHHSS